jgi:hypothetical protein
MLADSPIHLSKASFMKKPRSYVSERAHNPADLEKHSGRVRRLRSEPVPMFNNRFSAALQRLGAALLESSADTHTGIKGAKREDAFRQFIADRLPTRYGVASGLVVDQFNIASPQLDVLVFDQTRNFSFSDGEIQILPAEALLVSIEIKSKLNADEVGKICVAARKLRELRPFKAALGGSDIGEVDGLEKPVRYLHCVFAYDTDLVSENWLKGEARRFRGHAPNGEHLIDAVYVLNRGLLNLTSGRGRLEDADGSAITSFYFSLLNFIQREGGRRKDTPYPEYASLLGGRWESLK